MTDASSPTELAVWSGVANHVYVRRLHDALRLHGIQVRFEQPALTDAFLLEHHHQISAFHFHWPEFWWKSRSQRSIGRRLTKVFSLWRFLRLARRMKIPIVWTIHNIERHEGSDWVDRLGMRMMGRETDLAIVHSESSIAGTARHGLDANKVLVMRIGTCAPVLAPRDRASTLAALGLPPNRRTLLCFGLLRPYKGIDLALDALLALGDEYQLVIGGEALDQSWIEQIQGRISTMANVRLQLGRLSDQALADLLHATDAVLLPYRDITGSAALVTALGAGRGVVLSDLPYFRETLDPERVAGEFCEVGSAASLERAIRAYFATPLSERNQAAERLAALYAWDRTTAPLADRLRVICNLGPQQGTSGPNTEIDTEQSMSSRGPRHRVQNSLATRL